MRFALLRRIVSISAACLILCNCGGGGEAADHSNATATYTVGGTVSGFSGSGLVLRNSGGNDLAINGNGVFVFSTELTPGAAYAVTVQAQPSNPTQSCVIANGSGTMGTANITNIQIACTTAVHQVGGIVSGLNGSGLVLQNNGGDDLIVNSDGSFAFSTGVATGSSYSVSVQAQPNAVPQQSCSVINGSGTMADVAITTIAINCRILVGKFLYVPNSSTNLLSAFSVDAISGALTPLPGSPFSGAGIQPFAALVDPSGKFLYVVGSNTSWPGASGTLAGYKINATDGSLTPIAGMPITYATESPILPVFSPSGGQLLVVANAGPTGHIYGYQINSVTGALTILQGTPYAIGRATLPTYDPAGRYFYVPTTVVSTGTPVGSIDIYTLMTGTNGLALTAVGSITTATSRPADALIDANGRHLYVTGLISNTLESFSIDATTGLLTVVAAPLSVGQDPQGGVFDRTGQFLYINNLGDSFSSSVIYGPGSISAFSVNGATGALDPIVGSPFATGGATSLSPKLDPTGRYLTVTNATSGTVTIFVIDKNTGVLTQIAGSPLIPAVGAMFRAITFDPSGRFFYVTDNNNTIFAYAINSTTDALTLIGNYPAGSTPTGPTVVGLQ